MKSKLILLIILVLLTTAIIPNFIYADEEVEINSATFNEVNKGYSMDDFEALKDEGEATVHSDLASKTKKVDSTLSAGATIATIFAGALWGPALAVSSILTMITKEGNTTGAEWFTIENTVFNRIPLFDTNYFVQDSNDNQFNGAIKQSVATFYYILRTIALVVGMLMLIYVGIRIALSTIASDKAKYKDMLIDWVVSMILIFAMPYIIGIINMIANGLVQILEQIAPESFEPSLINQVINLTGEVTGWSYFAVVLMYVVLTIYQVKFFLMYLNRMFSMGFLIVISPLITIPYSATKTSIAGKDGRSPMLERWFKEYSINAFIQPLHAAIYIVFIASAREIFTVAPLLAVIFFAALSRTERIVKNILGMRKMSSIHSMSGYLPIKKRK